MCEIPDNYICVDDIMDELNGLRKSILDIHFRIHTIYRDIDVIKSRCVDEHRLQEPLRELNISKELEDKVQDNLNNLTGEQK